MSQWPAGPSIEIIHRKGIKMDVIVTGRRISINDATRDLVSRRLNDSIVKLKDRVIRTEVEFTANESKGDPSNAIRC